MSAKGLMKRAIGIVIFLLVARATGAQIEVKDSGQSATTTVTAASATVMPQSEQGPTDTKDLACGDSLK